MDIGIRNGSLRAGWLEAIETAGRLGYDGVELDIDPRFTESLLWQPGGTASLDAACLKADVVVCSLCLGALWTVSPASDNADTREGARDLIAETARKCAGLGARWILVPITPGGSDADAEAAPGRWIETMSAVAPDAGHHGVVFCLENVGGGCGRSAADLIRLADGIDSPYVGVYYDVGNAVHFGFDPAAEIRQLGDRIRVVHIKDNANRLGEGDVPLRACLKALHDVGYGGWFVFETNATDSPAEAGAYNLGYFRGLTVGMRG